MKIDSNTMTKGKSVDSDVVEDMAFISVISPSSTTVTVTSSFAGAAAPLSTPVSLTIILTVYSPILNPSTSKTISTLSCHLSLVVVIFPFTVML
jgi:hypothetical protein